MVLLIKGLMWRISVNIKLSILINQLPQVGDLANQIVRAALEVV